MKTAPALALLASLSLLTAPAWGQVRADSVGEGEFPGLQLLPPGSVIKGISLPRYENHRVTSLMRAAELRIVSRSELRLTGLVAELYAPSGEVTGIHTGQVDYSFETKLAESRAETRVSDPRFTARGSGVIFSSARKQGLLRGPVRTTIPAAILKGGKPGKEAGR